MKFKTIELKSNDSGSIEGYFSTYENTPDSYGDIIMPGAFTNTIKKRKATGHPFPICFNHDFSAVIGACEVEEKDNGPFMTGLFIDTQQAQDVRKMVQSGAIYQFSFAYDVLKEREPDEEERKSGVTNVLEEIEVYEVSVVTVPANQNAIITDIKSYIADIKSGRRNSKKDADAIRQAITLLQGVLDDADDSEEDEPDDNPEGKDPKAGNSEKDRLLEYIKNIDMED